MIGTVGLLLAAKNRGFLAKIKPGLDLLLAGVDITVIQEWLGHVSINTTCRYKGIPIDVKREALRKFYLFDQSSVQATAAGIDWSLYPDLLAYLQSL